VRSLWLVSAGPEDIANKENVNEAVIVASKIDSPYRLREVANFKFSDQAVGKVLIDKTERALQELRKVGFEFVEFKVVKPTGEVTAPLKRSAACPYNDSCGDLGFKDPLNTASTFVVRKEAISKKANDVEHTLIYRDATQKELVLQRSLFDKKGYARNGISYPTDLVFWKSYVTGLSAWCKLPSPWTYKLMASRVD
jgi:hypothetical protein